VALDEDRLLQGVVFRRLGTWAERPPAPGLCGAGAHAYRSPRLAGDEAWAGLWNLTADDGAALTAAAATLAMSARVLEVRALIVRAGAGWPAMCRRLVRELADEGRAHGAEWLVAGAAAGDPAAPDLLRRAGFGSAGMPGLPEAGPIVWLAREV
jgi:hypothetical protein